MLIMQEACLGQAEEQRIPRPDRKAVHPTHHPSRSDLPAVPHPGHCQAQAFAQENRQAPVCIPLAALTDKCINQPANPPINQSAHPSIHPSNHQSISPSVPLAGRQWVMGRRMRYRSAGQITGYIIMEICCCKRQSVIMLVCCRCRPASHCQSRQQLSGSVPRSQAQLVRQAA